jgi:ketosteroid isomerase-like protein
MIEPMPAAHHATPRTANEELVVRAFDAFNDSDWETLESLWDPDGEIVAPASWPEPGPRRGWPAIRAQFELLKGSWSEDTVFIDRLEEPRDGVVLGAFRWRGRGAGSGADVDLQMWIVGEIRDGRLHRCRYFLDGGDAAAVAEGAG